MVKTVTFSVWKKCNYADFLSWNYVGKFKFDDDSLEITPEQKKTILAQLKIVCKPKEVKGCKVQTYANRRMGTSLYFDRNGKETTFDKIRGRT